MDSRSYVSAHARSAFALCFSLGALFGAGCAAPCAERVVVATDPSASGITVSGTGEASGKPDIGHIQLGFEARAATADRAMADANTVMTALVAALKAFGIAEKDLRTNRVSLDREFQPQPPLAAMTSAPVAAPPSAPPSAAPNKGGRPAPAPPAPTPTPTPQGYEVFRASSSVTVTLRDLDKASLVIAAATRAGSNDIGGLDMTVEDPKPLEKQARDKAVADARDRAEQLAKLAGVKLGPVESIQEGSSGGSYAPQFAMARMAESQAVMPIERGVVKVTRQVQVRFSIAR